MKTLISTLILAGSLVLSGCGDKKAEIKKSEIAEIGKSELEKYNKENKEVYIDFEKFCNEKGEKFKGLILFDSKKRDIQTIYYTDSIKAIHLYLNPGKIFHDHNADGMQRLDYYGNNRKGHCQLKGIDI